MGIPYSRQINAAFEQVNPLIKEGFKVLQSTKDISLLLAEIQVITVLVLCLILVALVALIFSLNPDLEVERKALVTPVMKYIASWFMTRSGEGKFSLIAFFWILTLAGVGYAHWFLYFRQTVQPENEEGEEQTHLDDGGEDVEAIKSGKTKQ